MTRQNHSERQKKEKCVCVCWNEKKSETFGILTDVGEFVATWQRAANKDAAVATVYYLLFSHPG